MYVYISLTSLYREIITKKINSIDWLKKEKRRGKKLFPLPYSVNIIINIRLRELKRLLAIKCLLLNLGLSQANKKAPKFNAKS